MCAAFHKARFIFHIAVMWPKNQHCATNDNQLSFELQIIYNRKLSTAPMFQRTMTKRKEFLLGTVTVLGTLLAMASIAEVVLRFLPVPTGLATVPVTADSP